MSILNRLLQENFNIVQEDDAENKENIRKHLVKNARKSYVVGAAKGALGGGMLGGAAGNIGGDFARSKYNSSLDIPQRLKAAKAGNLEEIPMNSTGMGAAVGAGLGAGSGALSTLGHNIGVRLRSKGKSSKYWKPGAIAAGALAGAALGHVYGPLRGTIGGPITGGLVGSYFGHKVGTGIHSGENEYDRQEKEFNQLKNK